MDRIIDGVCHFQANVFPKQRALFQRLAQGQQPETLVIACSDSRISLELITQSSPGELFVCRNAGNIVPAYGHDDAVGASIEYALAALPIRDIVVCGHSDCGAMKGLLMPQSLSEMPHVQGWLAHARAAVSALKNDGGESRGKEAVLAVAKLNISLQIEHLHTYPEVFARVRKGDLRLHGWLYEIETGEIHVWKAADGKWFPIGEIEAGRRYQWRAAEAAGATRP